MLQGSYTDERADNFVQESALQSILSNGDYLGKINI
jgi:hypothetical protein